MFEKLKKIDSTEFIELNNNDELTLEKNLVWIIGVPRSGTTWLGTELLNYNSQIINEWYIGTHLGSMRGGFLNKDFLRDYDHYQKSPNYFFSNKYKITWLFFLRKIILNRVFAQFGNLTKKVIIKDPSSSLIPDIIAETVPNSKIIFLIRDGRDVVDSNVDAFQGGTWRTKKNQGLSDLPKEKYLNFIKRFSRSWKKRTELMLKTYENSQNCMIVRYENLRTNTLEELEKIYKFVGMEINNEELKKIVERHSFENIPEEKKGKGKFTRSASPGLWKENLSEEEKTIMNDIMGETLQKLGY